MRCSIRHGILGANAAGSANSPCFHSISLVQQDCRPATPSRTLGGVKWTQNSGCDKHLIATMESNFDPVQIAAAFDGMVERKRARLRLARRHADRRADD